MKSSNADFISWTWLSAYLVGPGTILMILEALSLPCHSSGERDCDGETLFAFHHCFTVFVLVLLECISDPAEWAWQ